MDPEVEDIVGPGRSEKIVKAAPEQTGRRIRRQAKAILLGGAVTVAGAIVIGVLLSGRSGGKRSGGLAIGAAPPELVGQATPPVAPLPPQPIAGTEGAVPGRLGRESRSAELSEGGEGMRSEGLPARPSGTMTPDGKYREWLVHQRYHVLEGEALAAQAARDAPLSHGMNDHPAGQPVTDGGVASMPPVPVGPVSENGAIAPGSEGSDAHGQDADRAFLADAARRGKGGVLRARVEGPVSRHELFAGSVIPAVLLTGIDSDLPGELVAQVRQSVYDSLASNAVLIPQGARLIGAYSSEIAYGQRRVLVAWQRIIFPDGATLAIPGMPGTDGLGRAGFHDQVDNHYRRIFGSALLISMLGATTQLSQPQNAGALNTPSEGQQAAANLANEMDSVGANLLNKNLGIQPTLTIRPGYLFNVLVTRTLVLPPYPASVR